MARQQCPSCGKHWTPPGPCQNFDSEVNGTCEFVERERLPDRPAKTRPTPERPSMPSDGYAATGPPVDPRDHLSTARAELARITEQRKNRGLPVGRKVA